VGILGVLLQYQRGEAAAGWWKRFLIFRPSDGLAFETENSIGAILPSSVTASSQYSQIPSIVTPEALHGLTNTDLRDTSDTRRPYLQGNDFETTGDDAESREVTATATSSDPRRWRVFSLLQTVIIHGITFVAGFAYTLAAGRGVTLKIPTDSIWAVIVFAALEGLSVALIGIMKQRTPWQTIFNFASTFTYFNIIIALKNIIANSGSKWMDMWLALLLCTLPLPLYLVIMVF
jgi:hypothetical protein